MKAGAEGPSCSIAFSDGMGLARWRVDVDVQTPDGRFRLGSVETVPSVASPPKARIVAMAYCPGALYWYAAVTSLGGPQTSEADVFLAVEKCCGPHAVPGVVPVPPFARSLDILQILDPNAAPQTSGVLADEPVTLLELQASSPSTANGGVATNLILFDATAVPGDGGLPAGVTRMPIPLPAGDVASISPNQGDRPESKGWYFRNGLVWASSSTYATKTEVGAQTLWVEAQLRRGA